MITKLVRVWMPPLLILVVQAALAGPPALPARSVEAVGVTVADMGRSLDFYQRVLGFKLLADREHSGDEQERLHGVFGARHRTARLALGEQRLDLTDYLAPEGRDFPADSRSNDHWFQHVALVVSDMDRAYEHLRRHGVRHASTGPQTLPAWNRAAGGIRAFYFRDPDGHYLEAIWFPPGKADPAWQRPAGQSDSLFLGIDHTAIVVADTEKSLAFYRDTLGMKVVGESENHGPEQERLNNVFGARLRITSLRAADGKPPGVEFLEYLSPSDGRPSPGDLRANDLAHWHTILRVQNLADWRSLRAAGGRFVSPGPIALDPPHGAPHAALMARDPDRHGLLLVQDQTP
jgi:catechol 2,3-dioxygenase-like lactoylglutathione lyase family enzyme